MTNEMLVALLSGLGAAMIGSIVTAWLTYRFQRRLLQEQKQFQRELLDHEIRALEQRDWYNRTVGNPP